jgi:prepilin-type N-terminal cleavage/methylation domain-containing protein
MRLRGFTLLETLAVVVLLSMAMAAVAVGVAGAGDAARLRGAVASMHDLDRRARLMAGAGNRVTLQIEDARVALIQEPTGERITEMPLPTGLCLRLFDEDHQQPMASLVFDATGCSPDYRVSITLGAQTRTYGVAGLTGWSGGPEARGP